MFQQVQLRLDIYQKKVISCWCTDNTLYEMKLVLDLFDKWELIIDNINGDKINISLFIDGSSTRTISKQWSQTDQNVIQTILVKCIHISSFSPVTKGSLWHTFFTPVPVSTHSWHPRRYFQHLAKITGGFIGVLWHMWQ